MLFLQRYQVVPPPELDEEKQQGCAQPLEQYLTNGGVEPSTPLPGVRLRAVLAIGVALAFIVYRKALRGVDVLDRSTASIADTNSIGDAERKFSMFEMSMDAYEKLLGDNDPFLFRCPVPGVVPVGINLPGGINQQQSCCAGYNHLGWPFQFNECRDMGLCTTCWEETSQAQMSTHPAIGFVAAAWAASVTVTGVTKPRYGWLNQKIQSSVGDLLSGDFAKKLPVVDDAEVKTNRMEVRIGHGLMGGKADVCPRIHDWQIDMLNEAEENIHARVFRSKSAKLAIVAFRGTQIQSMRNWHVNTDVKRVPLDLGNGNITMVHEGFMKVLEHVLPQVKRWVDGYVFGLFDAVPKDWDLIFTGHSLGGALATLAATKAELDKWTRTPRATVVFGSPRVADGALDQYWQSRGLCDRLIRVNTYNDMIHVMPFAKMWSAWTTGSGVWDAATGAVDCLKSPLDCFVHGAHSAERQAASMLPFQHDASPDTKSIVISDAWSHVCPSSEILVPGRVKGVNQELEELSLFGGVLAHLTDNCFYGYAYGVMHSNITTFDKYCGVTPLVCDQLQDMRPE